MFSNYLLKNILYIQAICGRSSTDTSDDFIEGLRHFDKVLSYIYTWGHSSVGVCLLNSPWLSMLPRKKYHKYILKHVIYICLRQICIFDIIWFMNSVSFWTSWKLMSWIFFKFFQPLAYYLKKVNPKFQTSWHWFP